MTAWDHDQNPGISVPRSFPITSGGSMMSKTALPIWQHLHPFQTCDRSDETSAENQSREGQCMDSSDCRT